MQNTQFATKEEFQELVRKLDQYAVDTENKLEAKERTINEQSIEIAELANTIYGLKSRIVEQE